MRSAGTCDGDIGKAGWQDAHGCCINSRLVMWALHHPNPSFARQKVIFMSQSAVSLVAEAGRPPTAARCTGPCTGPASAGTWPWLRSQSPCRKSACITRHSQRQGHRHPSLGDPLSELGRQPARTCVSVRRAQGCALADNRRTWVPDVAVRSVNHLVPPLLKGSASFVLRNIPFIFVTPIGWVVYRSLQAGWGPAGRTPMLQQQHRTVESGLQSQYKGEGARDNLEMIMQVLTP